MFKELREKLNEIEKIENEKLARMKLQGISLTLVRKKKEIEKYLNSINELKEKKLGGEKRGRKISSKRSY